MFRLKRKAFTMVEISISIALVIIISALMAPKLIELYKTHKAVTGIQQVGWFVQNIIREPELGLNTSEELPCIIKNKIDSGDVNENFVLKRLVVEPLAPILVFTDYQKIEDGDVVCINEKRYWVPFELSQYLRLSTSFTDEPSYGITGLSSNKYILELLILKGDDENFSKRVESMILSNLFSKDSSSAVFKHVITKNVTIDLADGNRKHLIVFEE